MNFVGVDVRGLDLHAFFALWRAGFVVLYVAGLVWLWRRGRVGIAVPLLLSLAFWFAVTFPLQRIYGLQNPSDRLRNLWWCATAAAGNSPFESGVVGQKTLEPAWSLLVSLLALRDPARVLALYPFLPALALAAVAFGIACALRSREDEGDEGSLRVLFACFFVLLAASSPLDYLGPFRSFWARNFLLKPNHVLGLALVPLAARAVSRWTAPRGVFGLLIFVTLGWIFIVDWLLLLGCLVVYAALRVWREGRAPVRDLARWLAVVAVSAAAVAPYALFIAREFPNAVTLASGAAAGSPYRSAWGDSLPQGDSLFFMATFDLGPLFFLAAWGGWRCWRRGRPLDLVWLALLLGAYAAWGLNAVLYYLARARTADEIFWFLVFTVCLLAGIGAEDVAGRLAALLAHREWPSRHGLHRPSRLAAAFLLLWLPFTIPWWWDPVPMDAHFVAALEPVRPELLELGRWLRGNTDGHDVVLAGQDVAVWVPALSGRRVLRTGTAPVDSDRHREEAAALSGDLARSDAARRRLGIAIVVWDPSLRREHGVDRLALAAHPLWREVFAAGEIVAYAPAPSLALRPDSGPPPGVSRSASYSDPILSATTSQR